MGNPLTEAREGVVAALEPLGVTIYGAAPESASPPAAVVVAGTTWLTQATFGAARTEWQVTLMATMQGRNAAALERLEQLAWDALTALKGVGVTSGPTTPRITKIGPAEVAASDITVQVLVTTTEQEV